MTPFEDAVASKLADCFHGHPLRPKFRADETFDPPIGWFLRVSMRLPDAQGRIRQMDYGITKHAAFMEGQKRVGARPSALASFMALVAGQLAYDEKVHRAAVDFCVSVTERPFRLALEKESAVHAYYSTEALDAVPLRWPEDHDLQ